MEREKRNRNRGESSHAAALAKLRQARERGGAAEYELDEVDNIFEEVDEAEYEVKKKLLLDMRFKTNN